MVNSCFHSLSAEPGSRIKKITIRDKSVDTQATVDDIKASVMSLKIGSNSPGIRKATSSQSLNSEYKPRGHLSRVNVRLSPRI